MDERELRELVRAVVAEATGRDLTQSTGHDGASATASRIPREEADPLAARIATWTGRPIALPAPRGTFRPEGDWTFYRSTTPARLGVGRAGTRLRTGTLLEFLADHAAARDAVWSSVEPDFLARLGLVPLRSAAADRREFLLRPDLGRKLAPASAERVRREGTRGASVQIVTCDGLSAAALRANLPILLPALVAELSRQGVAPATMFFVEHGRMAVGDEVGRLVEAEVLCTIVGERPGLKTAESLGAYVTYLKVPQIHEARRSMISNIHAGGLPPAEGARQVAALCLRALRERRTGVDPGAT
ncbi:MAG: ethanolamine ammonia-lyase subunit EutC [Myxococcales bacterium]|nr:ethanolamine ammonia-lyase subunit EutC [Myxococcales bacterium]